MGGWDSSGRNLDVVCEKLASDPPCMDGGYGIEEVGWRSLAELVCRLCSPGSMHVIT